MKKSRVLSFLLSEEHESIPISEILSILTAENIEYRLLSGSTPLVRIEIISNLNRAYEVIAKRASMVKLIVFELIFLREFDFEIFKKILKRVDLNFLQGKFFYVRIVKKGKNSIKLSSTAIEATIGEHILRRIKAHVRFKSPDYVLCGILCNNMFSFGILLKTIKRGIFLNRSPRKRPFFISSALDVFTARVMVNLAGTSSGSVILDPFAGTGGILIEAGLTDHDVLGFDVKKRVLKGCLKNLTTYIRSERIMGIVQADSLRLPLRDNCVDAIVTDPPYGRSSTTLGRSLPNIYNYFLPKARRILKPKGKLVILYPHKLSNYVEERIKQEFRVEGKHLIKVHKNLLRVLVVASKEV
ncbi:MAG: hypothetical protein DRJ38_00640 [Thermoprotei archaeon]|nr:MAG: hypothetical protein DRJ38_00640 [Thermoprotei archaeon]